ncbi:sulfatase-like hydrolase/transferase [Halomonas sp. MES3-P3E]|uniref:sulfatase-like hydrolase/transferase n=1 Tax=Halomonas sp. MES3-P3E TaxID=2058321 RepID=UPI0012FF2661|nr:sulfatase-like hydrolase/transferase [Halomonas sp. MES3-P3E]
MSGMPDFLPLADCLGDYLNDQGYRLDFMGGADLDFAGKGKFYQTHGFANVDGVNELASTLNQPPMSDWGIYDDMLLESFRQRLEILTNQQAPFGLFGLTLDTHHPSGHIPPACENIEYADGEDPMLNAVHCADRLVGQFIEAFMESSVAQDTVLVVMSDHLAMRNTVWERLETQERRNLLMMFSPHLQPGEVNKPGSTLDLAPTLLTAMGYETQGWGFGRNLFSDTPTLVESEAEINDFLNRQRGALSALWSFPQMSSGIRFNPPLSSMQMEGQQYPMPALLRLDADANVESFTPSSSEQSDLLEQMATLTPDENFVWSDQCRHIDGLFGTDLSANDADDSLCLAVGRLEGEVHTQQLGSKEIDVTHDDIINHLDASEDTVTPGERQQRERKLERFNTTGSWYEKRIVWPGWDSLETLTIRSAGFGAGQTHITQGQSDQQMHADVAPQFHRGVSLVGVNPEREPALIKHVDTCQKPIPDTGFAEQIASLQEAYSAFAVIVHDTAFCQSREAFDALLKGTPFSEWHQLGFREPYIGLMTADGTTHEIKGRASGAASITLRRSERKE